MVSTITQRIGGAVNGVPVNTGSGGIVQCINVTGTNDYVADTSPAISQYYANQLFLIRLSNGNTGPVTLNLEGLGALPWKTPNGSAHANGDLSTALEYLIKLSSAGTEFRTISPF